MRMKWERLEGRTGHEVGRQLLRQLYREEVALPRLLFWQNGAQDPTAIQPMRRWPFS